MIVLLKLVNKIILLRILMNKFKWQVKRWRSKANIYLAYLESMQMTTMNVCSR